MELVVYTHNFLTSLVFTCAIETVVLILFVRVALRQNIPLQKLVFAGVFASFATTTYVWYVFPVLIPRAFFPSVYVSEPFVFLVEALFYRMYLRLSWRDAIIASFLANVASYLGGPAIRALGLWPRW